MAPAWEMTDEGPPAANSPKLAKVTNNLAHQHPACLRRFILFLASACFVSSPARCPGIPDGRDGVRLVGLRRSLGGDGPYSLACCRLQVDVVTEAREISIVKAPQRCGSVAQINRTKPVVSYSQSCQAARRETAGCKMGDLPPVSSRARLVEASHTLLPCIGESN